MARSTGQTSESIGTVIQTITGDVVIASEVTYNGTIYPVTAVGSAAFYGKTDITSVTFPSSIKNIDSWAFSGCTGLTSITLPEDGSDIVISGGAFEKCTGLTSLTIPGSVKTLTGFYYCTNLQTVTIAEGVTEILVGCFQDCNSLKSVNIPEGVTSIPQGVFQNCNALESITIPSTATYIGVQTFFQCYNMKELTFAANSQMTSLGWGAFKSCEALESFTIPKSLTTINDACFWNCKSLNNITIEEGNTNFVVEDGVLYNADKTRLIFCLAGNTGDNGEFTIPDGVTEIDSYAFASCEGITKVNVPASVTKIGASAFCEYSGVIVLNMESSTPPEIGNLLYQRSGFKVKVPYGAVDAYKAAWGEKYNDVFLELPGFEAGANVKSIKSSSYDEDSKVATVVVTIATNYAYVLDNVKKTGTETEKTATTTGTTATEITLTVADVDYSTQYTVTFTDRATFASADATKGSVAATWTAADKATVAVTPATGYQLVSATRNKAAYTVATGATSIGVTGIETGDAYVFTFDDIAKSATFTSADATKGTVSVASYKGATATVAISPATGYQLVSATKNKAAYTVTKAATSVSVTDIKNADAYVFTFDDIAKSATFTAGDNGAVSVDSYAGTSATVTITPADGYKLLAVTQNGTSITVSPDATGKATITGIANGDAFLFSFTDASAGATFTAGEHGTVSASLKGSTATVTITPDDGYEFSGATKNSESITVTPDATGKATITKVGGTDVYFFSFTDIARGATFAEPENGTISVAYSGATASVTVTPNTGYVFEAVAKDGTTLTLTPDESGVVTITGVKKGDTYVFTFVDIASKATFVAGSNGTISGTTTYAGTTAYVTVTPSTGYVYSSVSSDKGTTFAAEENGGVVTISGVEAGATYTVNFTDVASKATFVAGDNGSIGTPAYSGASASFAVAAAEGYVYSSVSCDASSSFTAEEANGTVTVSGVEAGATYTVNFTDVASKATFTAGENCAAVSATYKGTTANVTVTPQAGYTLSSVTKNGGEYATGLTSNSIEISGVAATDVYVFNCIDISKTVSFAETVNGTIADDSFEYSGAQISFTVRPADGYEFDGITSDNGGAVEFTEQDGVVTITGLTAHTTYTVTFKQSEPKAIVTPDADAQVEAIYDLAGHKVAQMSRGIYFVRYSNGAVKKVLKR